MIEENVYLELLKSIIDELKEVVDKREKYDTSAYNCILSGLIIRMNAVMDQCLSGFHSDKFTPLIEMIYNTRQYLVHHSDFVNYNKIDDIALDIIAKFEKIYKNEKSFFKKMLAYQVENEHNVVVNKKYLKYDAASDSYVHETDALEVVISADKVTKVQDLVKKKDTRYIINCDRGMNYFSKDENDNVLYQELKGHEDIQCFFIQHLNAVDLDFTAHKNCIYEIIERVYRKKNFNSVYVVYNNLKSKKANPVYIESSKVLNDFFNEGIVYEQLFDYREYTNLDVPKYFEVEYKKIRENLEKMDYELSKKDYFYITKTLAAFAKLQEELKKIEETDIERKEVLKMAMLINWSDHAFRHISHEFVSLDKEFEKLHLTLLDYRTFFAHNIYQLKSGLGSRVLDEFYDMSCGYISVLASLNIAHVDKKENSQLVNFLAVERAPINFENYRRERFVKIDPTTYLGNKLFYSTKGSVYQNIVGLVSVSKHFPVQGGYYQKAADGFVNKTYTDKKGKKHPRLVSKMDYSQGQEVCFDVNIDALLYIYAAYKGKIEGLPKEVLENPCHKKAIFFHSSPENGNREHATTLNDLISNYYQLKYLPYELVQDFKIGKRYNEDGKLILTICTKEDVEIGYVVDCYELKNKNVPIDEKGFFKVSDTMNQITSGRTR